MKAGVNRWVSPALQWRNDTDTNTSDFIHSSKALRNDLVARLRELGAIRSEAVEAAVRHVPRHVFMPEVTLPKAYEAENEEATKRDQYGVALSSESAMRIQAFMLEQADIRPGMRVLEVGSGGYNAALMAELVGADGDVTTIDTDPNVVERARALLAAAGYERVNAMLADDDAGELGHAPYDRIVVTVGAPDLAVAWVEQLATGGRMIVPLQVRGLPLSVSFDPQDGHLVGRDYELCGFVPMQRAGERRERLVVLHDGDGEQVRLWLDPRQQVIDAQRLSAALFEPGAQAWSWVTLGAGMPYNDLDLWLAATLPDYALLQATRLAHDRGLVASWSPLGVSTLLEDDSFAYLAYRPIDPEQTKFILGAVGHGPNARRAANRLAAEIDTWGRRHRARRAAFRAYPLGTPDARLPAGMVIDQRNFRVTISWAAQ